MNIKPIYFLALAIVLFSGIVSAATRISTDITTGGQLSVTGTSTFMGNVGIGTTTPYAKLSVVGETVSAYFTATSPTATSTFAGGILSKYLVRTGTFSSKGTILGDSTIAAYLGYNGVDTYLLSGSDAILGTIINNQAVAGHTINQQKAVWDSDPNKTEYDWIIVEVGLNDVKYTETNAIVLARYQALIDDINSTKKPTAIVIVATMVPVRQRLIDLYGVTNGLTAYSQWQNMNTAIMGGGANAITGVQYRVNAHTAALSDGNGNLAAVYNHGDNIHENNVGRAIIANALRQALNQAGYADNLAAQPPVTPFFPYVSIGTSTPLSILHVNNHTTTTMSVSADLITLDSDKGMSANGVEERIKFTTAGSAFPLGYIGSAFYTSVANSYLAFGVRGSNNVSEVIRMVGGGNVGIGTTTPATRLHISSGASATTTVSIGELGLSTSKGCVNMNQADGSAGSFYLSGGTLKVENNYCR
ncbi:MAG: SGNH/GDSL hydrolase family protein [Candidatus Paceibacterota bacterium]|jgi:lysophospholipase L1-like esterase